ncbi:MAG: hypothetical protein ACFFCW_40400 [Candidatus Hodarchaeota archaeon]
MNEANLRVLIVFIAGLFSLLGAFAGGFLAKRSEHLKWLRQSRSEAFAEFLHLLTKAQNDAINVLHEQTLEPLDRDIRVTEIYSLPENYARVVRLYLPKSRRDEFSSLIREIRGLHASLDLGGSRFQAMEKKLDRIQEIFEETLGG